MAKKQGVSYSPNTALIQGEALARTDFSNAPSVYSGLDEAAKAGTELIDLVGEEAEKDEKKLEKKLEEKQEKYNDTADEILLKAGALGDVMYGNTNNIVKAGREKYDQAIIDGDNEAEMKELSELNNHSIFIQDHKQTNLDVAAMRLGKNAEGVEVPELSNYFKNTI